MRVAISEWNGVVAPVFDASQKVRIFDEGSGHGEVREFSSPLPSAKVYELLGWGVDLLICGAISRPLAEMLESAGVRTVSFVRGEVEEVWEAWNQGRLATGSFTMPGCRRRGKGCRRRGWMWH
ncbi:Dinitrogenase iron-molybdenum cofactor biosynthesis protein [Spirochaeta thermophila DSM 6578]|uniref:Dinitrogenase iron-molybdenum cofactor biosynthesis protein n=1 Tax=Winmispira thermophila (strain ATCC 700085 / DSM 6578 / Z-1203) TaxID=869211 RepID=G0GAL9_WINT7|nr:NifB/NifX family molybdenum-iron cluster-binding protein [Spirochaeta thermophila]AEJ60984.1 Dinitrogenase iron-molybdenum cofactor biosynthesis protein [Spirochaeta thermophila DSM 6578]